MIEFEVIRKDRYSPIHWIDNRNWYTFCIQMNWKWMLPKKNGILPTLAKFSLSVYSYELYVMIWSAWITVANAMDAVVRMRPFETEHEELRRRRIATTRWSCRDFYRFARCSNIERPFQFWLLQMNIKKHVIVRLKFVVRFCTLSRRGNLPEWIWYTCYNFFLHVIITILLTSQITT